MKTEIKIINENRSLTNAQLKSMLGLSITNTNIEVINNEISQKSIRAIQDLRLVSTNLTDLVNRLNKTMAKTNIYKGVEIIYHDSKYISLLFKKKNCFNFFVYEDLTSSFTLNNIITDFDTVEGQIGIKPQIGKINFDLNYLRAGFLYSIPWNGFDSDIMVTGFNRNKLFITKELITPKSSVKGLQIGFKNRYIALYAKDKYDGESEGLKWVLRYKDKNLFNYLNSDLKLSINSNQVIGYLARVSKEHTWPFLYLKTGFFLKNRLDAVISSKNLNLNNDKGCYYFGNEIQSSKYFVNNTIRFGTINSLGKNYYSVFSYVNGLVYRDNNKFAWNLSTGIGARLFITSNFVFEGLINLDKGKDSKRAMCKIIYGE